MMEKTLENIVEMIKKYLESKLKDEENKNKNQQKDVIDYLKKLTTDHSNFTREEIELVKQLITAR